MRSDFSGGADFRRDIDALKDDLSLFKADLAAAMRDLVEAGKATSGEARERLEAAVHEKLDRLNDAASNLADRGRAAARTAGRYVEEKPIQSLAIAFGVGVLVGAVLRK